MAINTYGLKIDLEKLQKASEETVDLPQNCGFWQTVVYDAEDGDVWISQEEENHWTEYGSPSVFKAANTVRHMSQQAIMDKIAEEMEIIRKYYADKGEEWPY